MAVAALTVLRDKNFLVPNLVVVDVKKTTDNEPGPVAARSSNGEKVLANDALDCWVGKPKVWGERR